METIMKRLLISLILGLSFGASAPIMPMHAMEKPAATICGTCGQVKPTLSLSNFSYFSIRAHRCPECRAILRDNIEAGRMTPNIMTSNIPTAPAPQEEKSEQFSILVTEPVDLERGNAPHNEPSMSNINISVPIITSSAIDIEREHCIACTKPLDNGAKPHIYSCKHAIHKDCFTHNSNQLKECFVCKTTGKNTQQEKSGWGWFSWGKASSKPETPQQQLDQLEQTAAHLSKRFNELQCSYQFLNQLLTQTNQDNAASLTQTRKQLEDHIRTLNGSLVHAKQELENRIFNLQANKELEQLKALLIYQQNLAQIERGSWLLGGAAALIAHNREYSATKAALIGLGTAASSYQFAKLVMSKPNQ